MESFAFLFETTAGAFQKIVHFDAETFGIFFLTLKIGITATFFGLIVSLPLAWLIHRTRSKLNSLLTMLFQALTAVPTVIVGTVLFLLFSRRGPLGVLELLYTPQAIVLGDLLLVIPLATVFLKAAFDQISSEAEETAENLGASPWQVFRLIMKECRGAIAASAGVSFGRAISEVGCAMILGGNLKGVSRTLTTSISLEMGKGETEQSMALGILLLGLALCNSFFTYRLQKFAAKSDLEDESGSPEPWESPKISDGAAGDFPPVPPIQFKKLTKKFGEKVLFENLEISLDLSGGAALMGPSGSGKTTLARMLVGLEPWNSGVIDRGKRRGVLIFQHPYLFSGTVLDNLTLGLRLRGMAASEAETKVEPLAMRLGLQSLQFRTVDRISGGEKARVALGRALVIKPEILFLDETLVHLDPVSLQAIRAVLLDYLRSGGGLLFITHNEGQARQFCRRLYRIETRRIRE